MDIVEEIDFGLRYLFDEISVDDVTDEDDTTKEQLVEHKCDEEADGEVLEFYDDTFSSYDFVNNHGEVETFWIIDPDTCTVLFDEVKATRIKEELAEKRKDRLPRKMDDKEIIPSRDEVKNQEFFPKYDDTDFVQELSR